MFRVPKARTYHQPQDTSAIDQIGLSLSSGPTKQFVSTIFGQQMSDFEKGFATANWTENGLQHFVVPAQDGKNSSAPFCTDAITTFNRINSARYADGMEMLLWDNDLYRLAELHARVSFSHVSSVGPNICPGSTFYWDFTLLRYVEKS